MRKTGIHNERTAFYQKEAFSYSGAILGKVFSNISINQSINQSINAIVDLLIQLPFKYYKCE